MSKQGMQSKSPKRLLTSICFQFTPAATEKVLKILYKFNTPWRPLAGFEDGGGGRCHSATLR
jgi:hypothetical protein